MGETPGLTPSEQALIGAQFEKWKEKDRKKDRKKERMEKWKNGQFDLEDWKDENGHYEIGGNRMFDPEKRTLEVLVASDVGCISKNAKGEVSFQHCYMGYADPYLSREFIKIFLWICYILKYSWAWATDGVMLTGINYRDAKGAYKFAHFGRNTTRKFYFLSIENSSLLNWMSTGRVFIDDVIERVEMGIRMKMKKNNRRCVPPMSRNMRDVIRMGKYFDVFLNPVFDNEYGLLEEDDFYIRAYYGSMENFYAAVRAYDASLSEARRKKEKGESMEMELEKENSYPIDAKDIRKLILLSRKSQWREKRKGRVKISDTPLLDLFDHVQDYGRFKDKYYKPETQDMTKLDQEFERIMIRHRKEGRYKKDMN